MKPTTPQNPAGLRIESPVSLPKANGTTPLPTSAALPPDDPPAILDESHGLYTGPVRADLLVPPIANSSILDLPIKLTPSLYNFSTTAAS